MKCPNCGGELVCVRASRDSVHTCKDCYLGGPRAELEALAAKVSAVEAELTAETRAQEAEECETVNRIAGRAYNPAPAPWLEDRIVSLEQQLEAERDRRIEAERELEALTKRTAARASLRRQQLRQARLNVAELSDMYESALGDLRRIIEEAQESRERVAELELELKGGRDG